MTLKIVTYDLNYETKRPPIVKEIQALGGWARVSESCYVVSTSKTTQQIFDSLRHLIDDNDNLYVFTLTQEWNGWGPQEVNDFIRQYI